MAYFRASEMGKGGEEHSHSNSNSNSNSNANINPNTNGITAIAIDADKNSQYAVRWAVDNLVTNKTPYCILIHVQCKTMHIGDHATVVSKEGRPPTQQELQQFFLPYRGFCARRGIESKEIILHDIDVSNALIDYIVHNNIANIVVGASQRNAITRKFKHPDIPTTLMKSAPETCAVYAISKGKVQTFRLASRIPLLKNSLETSTSTVSSKQSSDNSKPNLALNTTLRNSNIRDFANLPFDSPRPEQASQISLTESWKNDSFDKLSSTDRSIDSIYNSHQEHGGFNFKSILGSLDSPLSSEVSSTLSNAFPSSFDTSGHMSFRSAYASSYDGLEYSNASASSVNSNTEQYLDLLEAEMRRLKLELQSSMELFNSVTKEAVLAKQMARDLHRIQTIETRKSGELKLAENASLKLASMENQRKVVALEAAQAAKRLAEVEKQKKIAEMKVQVQREAPVKPKDMESLSNSDIRCRRYTIEEIEEGTDHFAPSNKIGEGGYGPVFKGMLSHFPVAIKMLRPDLSQGQKQFKQEVDVLSSMRHPHMVILLGACPDYGCLVYEYMEMGSLEDRLYRKDNTPPLSWRTRFRIAYEIATALLFLHETKPEPLVHRDLKPANILLDYNFVSKIGDVGLARLVPPQLANHVTEYHMTAAAGTFCYIDPEYQQTGMLGTKSDLYSFGVVLLQLLTARPAMGLSYCVEDAIEKGKFPQTLDPTVKNWPLEEALSVAKIAMQCCELRKKDRPDLANEVLPLLRRLRDLAVSREHVERETIIPLTSPVDLVSDAQSNSSEVSSTSK